MTEHHHHHDTRIDIPWYVKLFGASLITVCTLVIIFAFNQMFTQINDMQLQMRSLNEKHHNLQERLHVLEELRKAGK